MDNRFLKIGCNVETNQNHFSSHSTKIHLLLAREHALVSWATLVHRQAPLLFKGQARFIHFSRKSSAKHPILKNHNWLICPPFKHK